MVRTSTGLRNAMMDFAPFNTLMNGGKLVIYSGPVPSSADAALGGSNVELCTIEDAVDGLEFETVADNGVLSKLSSQAWEGEVTSAGTATFYRFYAPEQDVRGVTVESDVTAASTEALRFQGRVGTAGVELNLASAALLVGTTQVIDYFTVDLPSY